MKSPNCTGAIIVRNNKVLMGAREYTKDSPLWVFPGGRCEDGESLETALRREVAEEIGVTDFTIVKELGMKVGLYTTEAGHDQVFLYACTTDQEPRMMEPEKFTEWQWFALDELPKNLLDQRDREFIAQALLVS
jgi:8-oxo-dGTP diphosphatase